MKRKFQLSASLICGDHLALGDDIKLLEKGGIDALHFDVMDGMFVPRFGFYPELLQAVRKQTSLTVDAHLMIENPERYVQLFVEAGADIVVPHAESTRHLDRAVRLIREAGGRAGVALNPGTPLHALEHVLPDIELVMLMAINPGIVGHKLIPQMMQKIADTRKMLKKFPKIKIEVDGGVSPESAARMVSLGADILVCGTSSIYKKDLPLTKTIPSFRAHIEKELKSL
ncbi:ribulose-phosphate 3-epimerase [Candidatus Kaiserbacteria bacterium RIFCSPLOWO2_01_FULL_53_17]|uniref:Ribulose-phosphate 3-epimerase n=1 Tax=Candidatus Kaiserbacteria bacterium RIFCSPLOWO2_01_FULL_53_17 TaxID=1798511 RepID=A0A1F6EG79_9BACT|nr:MAG: ribulose-phosphate 3-epimerase [Candidatus Kaiserbacteria bacterium RIFCSPLOWO2_01_FULL_53_17]